MPHEYYLKRNHDRKDMHKFYVTFINEETNRENKIGFGHKKYEDMTTHHDYTRRKLYRDRHSKNENWNDLTTSGAWSLHLLWNKYSLTDSIRDMEKKFNIKIHY